MRTTRIIIAMLIMIFSLSLSAENLGRRIIEPSYSPKETKKIKVAFFDADSTLRIAPSGKVSANGERDVWILPGVSKEIARLNKEGYLIAIVSNQGGVPKIITLENADKALDFVRKMVGWLNREAVIHYYDFAENNDHDRKPETGMMERLEKILQAKYGDETKIDRELSFLCGDSAYKKGQKRPDGKPSIDFSSSDREVAENYGIRFVDPADFFGWNQYGVERFTSKSHVDAFFKAHPELKLPVSGPCPFPSITKKLVE